MHSTLVAYILGCIKLICFKSRCAHFSIILVYLFYIFTFVCFAHLSFLGSQTNKTNKNTLKEKSTTDCQPASILGSYCIPAYD